MTEIDLLCFAVILVGIASVINSCLIINLNNQLNKLFE